MLMILENKTNKHDINWHSKFKIYYSKMTASYPSHKNTKDYLIFYLFAIFSPMDKAMSKATFNNMQRYLPNVKYMT